MKMNQLKFLELKIDGDKIRLETIPCYDCAILLSKKEVMDLIKQLKELVQKI